MIMVPLVGSRWADAKYPSDQLTVVGLEAGEAVYVWDGNRSTHTKTFEAFAKAFTPVEGVAA